MKEGRKYFLKGIAIYPLNKIAFLHFLSSFLGYKNYQKLRKFNKSI
jgi:hypothetical protein